MTFVTLECVRACVWLLPSLRSVGACVWECGPGCRSGSSLYIYVQCVLTYFSFAVASSTHHTSIDHGAPGSCTVRAVDGALVERAARALDEAAPLDRSARAVQSGCVAVAPVTRATPRVFSHDSTSKNAVVNRRRNPRAAVNLSK